MHNWYHYMTKITFIFSHLTLRNYVPLRAVWSGTQNNILAFLPSCPSRQNHMGVPLEEAGEEPGCTDELADYGFESCAVRRNAVLWMGS